uniref:2-C-methyl-D-erythritol 4-phosphate cytidylyltransferase-like protein n=1 Tax=Clastoptera arizonana TaxID=38151 RepID=A0A1B6DTQ5_9HEMI
MVDFCVGVVIAAAGSGSRLGGSIPKQYQKIFDKPLLLYAIEEFNKITYIKKIALVVDNLEKVKAILQEFGLENAHKIFLVKGELTRHRSIRAGLQELQKNDDELRVVIIHDGVRPIIPESLVKDLVISADQHGAAGAIRPLVSTVLRLSNDNILEESLDRSIHVASETPQAFQLTVIVAAYNKCLEEDLDTGTECLQLALKYCGIRAKLIQGSEDLWKVTYKKDLYTAQASIREKKIDVCVISEEKISAASLLVDSLSNHVSTVKRVINITDSDHCSTEKKQATFNTVVLFHEHEIQDQHLVDFSTMLDLDRQGLIIHVIDNANVDGMQSMSVYNLHRSGRTMAHHYEKLHKGVVVIHCITNNEDQRLVDLVTSLILADSTTFSGQTLFI